TGDPGRYPVDLEFDPPQPQNRWTVGFRIFLVVPSLLLALSLGGGGGSGNRWNFGSGLVPSIAVFAWFASLVRGRPAPGFRGLMVYGLGYGAQMLAYALLLTARYPNSSPALVPAAAPPPLPVRLTLHDDGRRSRLTVFFRLLLALPHIVWILLWSIAAYLAAIANWAATLVLGRSPSALHRFLAAYLPSQAHLSASILLPANPFPGFTGRPGTSPVGLGVEGIEPQNRWVTGFRGILAFPAIIVSNAYGGAAFAAAFLGWFAALVTGRMPP